MLKQCSPPLVYYVSQDTRLVLIVMGHKLHVTCHVSCVTSRSPMSIKGFFFICSFHLNVFLLPTSQSPMSIFSESLGKSNKKKWPQIWKLLLMKGKHRRAKKAFFSVNFASLAGFFWYLCYYPHQSRDSLSPVCRIFLDKLVEQVGGGSVFKRAYPV